MARCQDMDKDSFDTFKSYLNSFKKDSVSTVLEAAIVINNLDKKQKVNTNILKKKSAEKLMEKMNEIFGLNIHKLKILTSSVNNLEDIRDEKIIKGIKSCHEMGSCDELRSILSDQGKQAA